ncbi:MAG: BLUF domain-containing protein [Rhodoplanes sp.]|uniref:BLUF domain-containing protein n=1 Tax=Rhodoplanes sp. TaxID=1968906 RepID=UPI00180AF029|nr:BLUF domain-containing protein [Rhodoplanes sp.]NVO16357.1 BLUF domain-containing protein [Rhodoplanes sp.]
MSFLRLVYYSRNRLGSDPDTVADQMADILSASIANNRMHGITGAMMVDERWFVQVLEGRTGPVTAAYERIAADPRHSDIVLADQTVVDERRFPYWWMAGAAIEPDMSDLVRRWCEDGEFDPTRMTPRRLVDLTEAVVTAYMSRTPEPPARSHAFANA